MFNILCHINRIHKILLFLLSDYVYFLSQLEYFGYSHTLLQIPPSPPMLVIQPVNIPFLHLFKHLILYIYRRQSMHRPFTKTSSNSKVDHSVSSTISGVSSTYHKTKSMWSDAWLLGKLIYPFFTYQWSSQYVSLYALNLTFL